jgi:hypothetical protein
MKKEWLHSKFQSLTDVIGHLYNRNADDDEEAAKNIDLYLNNSRDWFQFRKTIRKGDELWFFRSDVESWRKGSGKEGYAIVRDDEIIKSFYIVGNERD